MANKVKVYNPDEYSLAFGPVLFEGFPKGTFIKVTWASPIAEDEAGIDGEVVISRTKDQRADVEVTLLSTSDSNDLMAVIANLGINAPGMAGAIHPIQLKDQNGREELFSANAYIKKRPDLEKTDKPGNKTWLIRATHLVGGEGGN